MIAKNIYRCYSSLDTPNVCNISSLRLFLFAMATFSLINTICISLLIHVEETQAIANMSGLFLKHSNGSLNNIQLKANFMKG